MVIDTADEAPLCSKGTLVDVKTSSPGGAYPDDRNGEYNAAANARQVRVNKNHHNKAKDLDTRLGEDQRYEFDAELSTFGRNGVVLGNVNGAVGEMPSHVDLLADVIADALTAEHLSYCGDRARRPSRHITARCFIARGPHRQSWVGTPCARLPEPRTNPERPTGPKPAPPCS